MLEETLDKVVSLIRRTKYNVTIGPQEMVRPKECIVDLVGVDVEEFFTGGARVSVIYSISFADVDRKEVLKFVEEIITLLNNSDLVYEGVDTELRGEFIMCSLVVKLHEVIYYV